MMTRTEMLLHKTLVPALVMAMLVLLAGCRTEAPDVPQAAPVQQVEVRGEARHPVPVEVQLSVRRVPSIRTTEYSP